MTSNKRSSKNTKTTFIRRYINSGQFMCYFIWACVYVWVGVSLETTLIKKKRRKFSRKKTIFWNTVQRRNLRIQTLFSSPGSGTADWYVIYLYNVGTSEYWRKNREQNTYAFAWVAVMYLQYQSQGPRIYLLVTYAFCSATQPFIWCARCSRLCVSLYLFTSANPKHRLLFFQTSS